MLETKIIHLKKVDVRLAKVIDYFGPIDIKKHEFDSFFFLTREIVGQMISAKDKKVIFSRLLQLCEYKLNAENISKLTFEQLRKIGLSSSKTRFIKNLADISLNNKFDFQNLLTLSDDEVFHKLKRIDGIGNWTAKMYLLFFLQRDDILPYEDSAFLQSFKWLYNLSDVSKNSIISQCHCWKPYSSIASRYLYIALDSGLTKMPIDKFLNYDKNGN